MERTFWKRIRFLWALTKVVPTEWHTVGNRQIEKGLVDGIEVTTILRDTQQSDGYSREELFEMLTLIRREEERHRWKVPEPHRCIHCAHFSLPDENGFCPAKFGKGPDPIDCQCSLHKSGLEEGQRLAIEEDLSRDWSKV